MLSERASTLIKCPSLPVNDNCNGISTSLKVATEREAPNVALTNGIQYVCSLFSQFRSSEGVALTRI